MAWLREPLLHFLALGALLSAIHAYRSTHASADIIRINPQQVRAIAEHYRLQYAASPTPAQLDALVERSIDEEIAYREALRLGLDRNDEIVRRRLVQKFEFLQQDLAPPAEPARSQLQSYYQAHLARYRAPERLTFAQVYVSADRLGDAAARATVQKLGVRLDARHATQAGELGDIFPGPTNFSAVTRAEIERVFGREGLAQDIFAVEPGRWSAPLRSGFGWHSVFISARQPAAALTFEQAQERVRQDYREAEQARANARDKAELRRRYRILREPAGNS